MKVVSSDWSSGLGTTAKAVQEAIRINDSIIQSQMSK